MEQQLSDLEEYHPRHLPDNNSVYEELYTMSYYSSTNDFIMASPPIAYGKKLLYDWMVAYILRQ